MLTKKIYLTLVKNTFNVKKELAYIQKIISTKK